MTRLPEEQHAWPDRSADHQLAQDNARHEGRELRPDERGPRGNQDMESGDLTRGRDQLERVIAK